MRFGFCVHDSAAFNGFVLSKPASIDLFSLHFNATHAMGEKLLLDRGREKFVGGRRARRKTGGASTSAFTQGWWVSLMVNLSDRANRTTRIVVNDNPELEMLRSNTNKNKEQNMWSILMRVGGFKTKNTASEFFNYWNKKSRGLQSRITRGILLVKRYHVTEGIIMWTTSKTKKEMISFYEKKRTWLETSSTANAKNTTSLPTRESLPSSEAKSSSSSSSSSYFSDFLNEKRKLREKKHRDKSKPRIFATCSCGKKSNR